ncbi:response regulator [Motiliproteus sp. SC1-56]|uniref:response regulator n=1 Tax=Motiliproteus sp. SC1-56 TaxID=2799565 RepID=UPI001A8F3446|nr:response regulator [Motiliproteus sp. SC1-56]
MRPSELFVLLVEPSRMQRNLIENHLRAAGIEAIEVCSGAEAALDAMRRDPPDLVLSALHLPDISGAELLARMRADTELRDIAFVLISSETQFRYLDPVKQAGATAILPKPFSLGQLETALRTTLHTLEPEGTTPLGDPELLRVLVVDDSPLARRFICKVLAGLGIEHFVEAGDGTEALERMQDEYFDLVVTDFNMPHLDGQGLTEQIRQHSAQPTVPIMMVTSEEDQSRLAGVQQAGVSAICDKPFVADDVRQLLAGLLAQR